MPFPLVLPFNFEGTNAKFNALREISFDIAGDVMVGDYGNNCIRKVTAAGVTTTVAGNALVAGGYKDGTGEHRQASLT